MIHRYRRKRCLYALITYDKASYSGIRITSRDQCTLYLHHLGKHKFTGEAGEGVVIIMKLAS